jgi:hypothetical protein
MESWLEYRELSIVARRQKANQTARDQRRERTERDSPWMATLTLSDTE